MLIVDVERLDPLLTSLSKKHVEFLCSWIMLFGSGMVAMTGAMMHSLHASGSSVIWFTFSYMFAYSIWLFISAWRRSPDQPYVSLTPKPESQKQAPATGSSA